MSRSPAGPDSFAELEFANLLPQKIVALDKRTIDRIKKG